MDQHMIMTSFPPVSAQVHDIPPLQPHCSPSTPFLELLSRIFHTCIPTPLALVSVIFGILSILAWLGAQMPQLWKNYQRGSVEGLSAGFLAIWLCGDICNLLGALWTGQMWFQQVVGGYYVFVDMALCLQWGYYRYYGSSYSTLAVIEGVAGDDSGSERESLLGQEDKKVRPSSSSGSRSRAGNRSLAGSVILSISMLAHLAGAAPTPVTTLEATSPTAWTLAEWGSILSWVSTFAYLVSRLPQLIMNFKRKSTDGIAIQLFIFAFFGNLFYSLSLATNPLGWQDYEPYGGGGVAGAEGNVAVEWWSRTLPFFLGAAGVLCMDAAVGWQWMIWGEGPSDIDIGMPGAPVASYGAMESF